MYISKFPNLQAEAEELAIRVEALTAENLSLKSEINRLTDTSEKLKLQNANLMVRQKYNQITKQLHCISLYSLQLLTFPSNHRQSLKLLS